MRVLVTGATGVIGQAAIPHLTHADHDVFGVARSTAAARSLDVLGVAPVSVDLFDRPAVETALAETGAEAVIHLATAVPPPARMTRARHWATNDALRTDAARNLVDAALAGGVGTVVIASITMNYQDGGASWLDEEHPVRAPFRATASALVAEGHAVRFASAGRRGVALRFSQLYGPGRVSAGLIGQIQARKLPLVGHGDNFVSNLHVLDAGSAVAKALSVEPGTYNVSDDAPVTSAERLTLQVESTGSPEPRRVAAPVARLLGGSAVNLLTVSQRVLNRRFRQAAGWAPQHASITDGWSTVVEGRAVPAPRP